MPQCVCAFLYTPPVSLVALALITMAVLTAGYLLYGSFIARQYRLDDSRLTPAHEKNDGVDFIPTRPFYLLGQHFSAIAAAGPIVGPIAACAIFGWLPCVLWIVLGVIFIGAVHDFSALIASVRHGAGSIAEIARRNIGPRAWVALIAFIWLALIYVIVAFTDVTAATFIGISEEAQAVAGEFNRGGAVAAASTMYLLLALVMGLVQRFLPERFRPMWLMTLIFVPATLGVVWLGTRVSTILIFDIKVWQTAILVYCFVASLLPLWLLQQSRGYLGGFVLYAVIGAGLAGVLFGGFAIEQPAVTDAARDGAGGLWSFFIGGPDAPPMLSLIFPFLFVTIACGACSGFHGLVCGGTTSRQIAKESHCKSIGFGAMLLEGLVAIIALATIMIIAPAQSAGRSPSVVYGEGIARFLTVFLGEDAMVFAVTFGTMAVATFVFDTLDVATRLGRYLLQELLGTRGRISGTIAAAVTAGVPLFIIVAAPSGSWRLFWTLFGTSNQLLASLTLLGVTVWLWRSGRRFWYVLIPMVFVMTITLCALSLQAVTGWRELRAGLWSSSSGEINPLILNGIAAMVLFALAGVFIFETWRAIRAGRGEVETAPA